MKLINSYLCPDCFSGNAIAQNLRTGQFLTCSGQIGRFLIHSGSHPTKPTGSHFLNADLGAYETGARQFGFSGWAGYESGGNLVLLACFPAPIANMEYFGSGAHPTSTGLLVLPSFVNDRCFPAVMTIRNRHRRLGQETNAGAMSRPAPRTGAI